MRDGARCGDIVLGGTLLRVGGAGFVRDVKGRRLPAHEFLWFREPPAVARSDVPLRAGSGGGGIILRGSRASMDRASAVAVADAVHDVIEPLQSLLFRVRKE